MKMQRVRYHHEKAIILWCLETILVSGSLGFCRRLADFLGFGEIRRNSKKGELRPLFPAIELIWISR